MSFAINDLASIISHWSADQIVGLADGDPVSTLPDSVSAWDLVGTTTTRPLYRPMSSIASLPAIEFDGADDWIITGGPKTLGGAIASACVIRLDTLKNYHALLSLSTVSGKPVYAASSSSLVNFLYSDGKLLQSSHSGTVSAYWYTPTTAGGGFAATTTYLVTVILGASGFLTRINGVGAIGAGLAEINAMCFDVPPRSVYASFGANTTPGTQFDGLLSEAALWTETQYCESLWVEGVLAHKYGIVLPTSHPFYAAAPTTGPGSGGGSTVIVIED